MTDYQCIHEELLQNHSLQIKEMETELNYKKEKLDELKKDNERMEKKIDEINDKVNKIIIASKTDDDKMDRRILKLETRQDTLDDLNRKNKEDFNLKLSIVTIIFIALTFYFNFIHHL